MGTQLLKLPDCKQWYRYYRHEGIAADLVQLVALRAGLKIELLPVKDWDESLAASKGKRCHIMSFLNQTPARDAETTILRVNTAFTQITGYSADEVIGKTPRIFASDRQDVTFYKAMWASIQGTGAWHGEIWNRRKNGEIYPEQLTITAVKGSVGQVTHYVVTLYDITKRKQLKLEVAQLALLDPLTHLPNRRLLNDRLSQALTRARRAQPRMAVMFIDLDKFKLINDTRS